MTREELQKVHDALSLLNCMVNCGEQHSPTSVNMTQAAFAILRKPLPPAEGAEEYLRKHPFLLGETEDGEDYLSTEDIELIKQLAPMLEEYATLHAQRTAEKMVSERLREELIGYDKFLSNTYWGISHIIKRDEAVDEYLKTREK